VSPSAAVGPEAGPPGAAAPARAEVLWSGRVPRPEHPRPELRREAWLTLNGVWSFRFDRQDAGERCAWYAAAAEPFAGRIAVPFPWQSALSGLGAGAGGEAGPDGAAPIAWYRRTFSVPAGWEGRRVYLHFGAVDYFARVWVNGQLAGEHEGGYDPFAFDVTALLDPGENTLVVRVLDPDDGAEIPHGKQSTEPPTPWDDCDFSAISGIWQPVWLEARPASHITAVRIEPDVPGRRALVRVSLRGSVRGAAEGDTAGVGGGEATVLVEARAPDGTLSRAAAPCRLASGAETAVDLVLVVPEPRLWDVDEPNLYAVAVRLEPAAPPGSHPSASPGAGAPDLVHTTFGMRQVEAREGKLWLNGRPIYLMSALDQGYWPGGLYTAPSDDALRADVAYAKRLGLNGLRKHLKVEDPRFAYWADRLGLLLWCDAPSPVRFTEPARRRLERDMRAMIARDFNHPSIIVWCPYNESWGLELKLGTDAAAQAWIAGLYERLKALDPTRLVVPNSGWSHVKTDVADFHVYTSDRERWRTVCTTFAERPDESTVLRYRLFADGYRHAGEPLMMSEFGTGSGRARGAILHWQTNELRRHERIVGYTYCELYDVEHELAGYALSNRAHKPFDYDVARVNSPDYVVLDRRPTDPLVPGAEVEVDVYVSTYGRPALHEAVVTWELRTVAPPLGVPPERALGRLRGPVRPYGVTRLGQIRFPFPQELLEHHMAPAEGRDGSTPRRVAPWGAGAPVQLWAWLEDGAGRLRARNYLDLDVTASDPARGGPG
jgi:hypothetical protein